MRYRSPACSALRFNVLASAVRLWDRRADEKDHVALTRTSRSGTKAPKAHPRPSAPKRGRTKCCHQRVRF